MQGFFPERTTEWQAPKAGPFRHLSMSILEMAVLTGVIVRVYRALVLSRADGGDIGFLALSFAVGTVLLLGMVTLHLGNFTLRQWAWRAPVFAVIEVASEALVSLGLIWLGREPLGSLRATFADWPALVARTAMYRITTIGLFAIALAGVVQFMRYLALRREQREHTLDAVR